MSKKIRVAFYEARFFDGHATDTAIYLYTGLFNWYRSKDSHCEIWTPDKHGYFDYVDMRPRHSDGDYDIADAGFLGTCYTSTRRGENNGVVSRPAYKVFKNPERWAYYEIEISDNEYDRLIVNMEYDVAHNKGYGKRTIAKFFNPVEKHRSIQRDYPICSGRVKAWLMVGVGKFNKAWKWVLDSPMRLSGRLEKMGYERKRITTNKELM